ncbi:MAG: NUDIX domain-containing protein [Caldilineaceae bacterium]|nr:NUDIX domain-containing protein [Caldilineaceae bacterium]
MIIYPAIDLRRGRCVRLRQGDPNVETVFGEDPAQMARHWVSQGAEWLHVVNLDGALGATQDQISTLHHPKHHPQRLSGGVELTLPINLQRLLEIRRSVEIPIQFGGGMRTLEDIRLALELGADRVVLGTVAVEKPRMVSEAIETWGADRIVVGIDARDGKVATHGWQETSALDMVELGHQMHAMGVRRVVYTDINRDAMLMGVNVEATARLGDITGLSVIASGGVAGINDIERLKAHEHFNIDGVIVGQALYTGNLDLRRAVEVGHEPLRRRSAGIVPYRRTEKGPEFLLLFNLFFEQWQFPRGGVRSNESDLACARRELQEETGLSIEQLHEECRVELHYTATIRHYAIERTVIYYLAEVDSGELCLGHEDHCEARWVDAQEAWELLTETGPEQLPALDAAVGFLQRLPQR